MSDFLNARAMALAAASNALVGVLKRTADQIDQLEADLPADESALAQWILAYGQASYRLIVTSNLLELVGEVRDNYAAASGKGGIQ